MNEFIKKEIINERTGADVSPIQIDTQSRYIMPTTNIVSPNIHVGNAVAPTRAYALEALAKLVQHAEESKERNEKTKLMLAIDEQRLKFKDTWSTRSDRYHDAYKDMLKSHDDTEKSIQEMISSSNYLTRDEKENLLQKEKLNGYRQRIGIQENKDKIFIQDQVREINNTNTQIIANGGQVPLTIEGDKKVETYRQALVENIYDQGKMANLNDEEIVVMLGSKLSEMEGSRMYNFVLNLQNQDLTQEEMLNQLNYLSKTFVNKDVTDMVANGIVDKYYKGNDKKRAKEYISLQLLDRNKKYLDKASKNLKLAIADKKAKEKIVNEPRNLKLGTMLEKNDFHGALRVLNGYNPNDDIPTVELIRRGTRAEVTGEPTKSYEYQLTGKTPQQIIASGEYIENYVGRAEEERILTNAFNVAEKNHIGKTEALGGVVQSMYQGIAPSQGALVINSIAQKGGYNQSVQTMIKATFGDKKAQRDFEIIKDFESTRTFSPKLTPDQEQELLEYTKYFFITSDNPIIAAFMGNNITLNETKKTLAEYTAGYIVQQYQKDHKEIFETNVPLNYAQILNQALESSHYKDLGKKKITSLINDHDSLQAIRQTVLPIRKLRNVRLKGRVNYVQ